MEILKQVISVLIPVLVLLSAIIGLVIKNVKDDKTKKKLEATEYWVNKIRENVLKAEQYLKDKSGTEKEKEVIKDITEQAKTDEVKIPADLIISDVIKEQVEFANEFSKSKPEAKK